MDLDVEGLGKLIATVVIFIFVIFYSKSDSTNHDK